MQSKTKPVQTIMYSFAQHLHFVTHYLIQRRVSGQFIKEKKNEFKIHLLCTYIFTTLLIHTLMIQYSQSCHDISDSHLSPEDNLDLNDYDQQRDEDQVLKD